MIVALTFQSFVAQVHVHLQANPASGQIHATVHDASPPTAAPEDGDRRGKPPSGGDPSSTCPLCQILAAGVTPLPTGPYALVALEVASSSAVPFETAPVTGVTAASYSWESRAPPLG
jgi:Protein of unknown function (DUF2946)